MSEMREPDVIRTEEELDRVLTQPRPVLQAFVRTLSSPLVVLGAGGKMGPTLCVLAQRAAEAAGHDLEVVAVSRFSDEDTRAWLERRGVRTLACDLSEPDALAGLPEAEHVVYLVGLKFGTAAEPYRTWAMNTLVPHYVAERYAGARIVALSTGNVYPLVPVEGGGSVEGDPLTPLGEYANACVARERIFEYDARRKEISMALIRLNYAVDLRYGVLLDLAQRIAANLPVDLTMGYLNCIWQGDANEMILRALDLAADPPLPLNLTGPEVLSVRRLAERLGALMDCPVRFEGTEAPTALLSDPGRICERLGPPPTSVETMLRWTAHWVTRGGPTLGKPTHFEVRDGAY